ncbi:AraC family transcriptional regulator [Neobacillus cucumis]|uniref:AraC family transcriptional regulator n=1 Tax=Neobacillus cucumis TaxID=1740721 RepID=A0A2N5HIK4_9BACI|nr:AraC family transcriptional regulator [Neobacillus cucumis]PLS05328.1 AraC family transcriptional regulator [Neobacillus cucumis]
MELGYLAATLNELTFSILLAGYKSCPPNWIKKGKKPLYHSLWFITKGNGEIVINGKKYTLSPGKLIVFTPGMICDKKTSSTEPLEFYFIRFTHAGAFEKKDQWHFKLPQELTFPLHGVYTIKNNTGVVLLLEEINSLSKRRGATTAFKQKILFQELLLTFIHDFHAQTISGDSSQVIEETIEYISKHYHQPITLDDLAKMAGLSKSHYSRLFKKNVGYSPIEYLTHLRIDRAKELLAHSDIRIKEVSQNVGYDDELYFSRIFKKVVGVAPTQFSDEQKTFPFSPIQKDGLTE